MKEQKLLIKVLYGYIGFAFSMVFLNILGFFRPFPDVLAAVSLLMACYTVGRYGSLPRAK